jgi:hypothetical protein
MPFSSYWIRLFRCHWNGSRYGVLVDKLRYVTSDRDDLIAEKFDLPM